MIIMTWIKMYMEMRRGRGASAAAADVISVNTRVLGQRGVMNSGAG